MDRQNGDAQKSVWEDVAETAGGGEVVEKPSPKRYFASLRLCVFAPLRENQIDRRATSGSPFVI
jgi:hypothetical protein